MPGEASTTTRWHSLAAAQMADELRGKAQQHNPVAVAARHQFGGQYEKGTAISGKLSMPVNISLNTTSLRR